MVFHKSNHLNKFCGDRQTDRQTDKQKERKIADTHWNVLPQIIKADPDGKTLPGLPPVEARKLMWVRVLVWDNTAKNEWMWQKTWEQLQWGLWWVSQIEVMTRHFRSVLCFCYQKHTVLHLIQHFCYCYSVIFYTCGKTIFVHVSGIIIPSSTLLPVVSSLTNVSDASVSHMYTLNAEVPVVMFTCKVVLSPDNLQHLTISNVVHTHTGLY